MAPVRIFSCFLVCWIILSGQTFAGYINVAKSKTTDMSGGPGAARKDKAVNGDTDGTAYGKCILTGSGLSNTWWEVDLGNTYYILYVKIYFRIDFTARRNGTHVYAHAEDKQYTSENLCGKLTRAIGGPDIDNITSITCNTEARYITLFQGTDNGPGAGNSMDFCEVEVYTCDTFSYGSNCDKSCSARHCAVKSSCSAKTGFCYGGCKAGWKGGDCTQDVNECDQTNSCSVNAVCTNTDGSYSCRCLVGYQGDGYTCADVNECGQTNSCSVNADCTNTVGSYSCTCRVGYQGTGYNCAECQSGVNYGFSCRESCQDRECAVSTSTCDIQYGHCDGGCQPGWETPDCTQSCRNEKYGPSCSKTCSERNCDGSSSCNNTNGKCDNGCSSGWEGIDCTECEGGETYGSACNKLCADRNCLNYDSCDRNTGKCVGGCQPGWRNADCLLVCSSQTYGAGCSKQCTDRQCKESSSCNHITGECVQGCKPGWKGADCRECEDTYGLACNLACSLRKCKDSASPCDPQTGLCVGGCEPGWISSTCTQQCPKGQYGYECKEECSSRHCHGNDMTCAVETGKCVEGCKAGWEGESCITGCSSGKYGINCNSVCGSCRSESCDAISGICKDGCIDGFYGPLCTKRSPQKASDTPIIAVSTITGILVLLLVISVIIIIRQARTVKKQSKLIDDKKKNEVNLPRTELSPSSVYEVVDGDHSSNGNPDHVSSQGRQTNMTDHDYVNASRSTESNQEAINVYEKLEMDKIGQSSPYDKFNMPP